MKHIYTLLVGIAAFTLTGHCATPTPSANPVTEEENTESTEDKISAFLGTVRTRAQDKALNLALDYGANLLASANKKLDITFSDPTKPHPTFFKLAPDFHMNTGDKDAFSGVVGKVKANWVVYPGFIDVQVPDHKRPGKFYTSSMPDPHGWYQVRSLSAGAETDGSFKTINGLIEAGWELDRIPRKGDWHLHTGVFLQAGYKFSRNKTGTATTTGDTPGDKDESKEEADETLARVKAELDITSPQWALPIADAKLSFIFGGAAWYDIANSETYHNVKGVARVTLSPKKHFDFKYENGSGAPNFNQGDQFSAGLTVQF